MVKELSKILKYKGSLFLEHMQRQIKDLIFCMNRVHNNNDFEYFMWADSLDDTTSNGKEFSFKAHNIDSVVKSFHHWLVVDMDISYKHSNIILNASVCYYEYVGQRIKGFNC